MFENEWLIPVAAALLRIALAPSSCAGAIRGADARLLRAGSFAGGEGLGDSVVSFMPIGRLRIPGVGGRQD